jgi:fructose-1,6-bisphosphatase
MLMLASLQLQVIFDCLKRSGVVHVAASEENPTEIDCEYQNNSDQKNVLQNNIINTPKAAGTDKEAEKEIESAGYSVAFDPLDGSSIVDANFAVGTIVGIWPGNTLLNRKGKEQVISADCTYNRPR